MKYLQFLLFSLLLFACVPVASPENIDSPMIQDGVLDTVVPDPTDFPRKTIRFLALGDSYTIGQSVSEEERWPNQLAARLEEQGIDAQVTIIARTGWTTENLLFALAADPPEGTYDIVSLLIGVNNQFRGGEPEEFRIRFEELLEQAIRYAGDDPRKVIVLSIPDWEVTPYAERLARPSLKFTIDDFNTVKMEDALANGVRYVDITPISRRVTKDEYLLASDGLHPSGEMYALWVEKLLPQVLDLLP